MVSTSDNEKYIYFRNYKIGRILLIAGYIPLFLFFGIILYMEQILFSSAANSQHVSNSTANSFLYVFQYFPAMIIVMMVLLIVGKRIMIRSIENILGKTRYELSPMEYRRAVREIKMSMKNKKSGTNANFNSKSDSSQNVMKDSNDDGSSPFSK